MMRNHGISVNIKTVRRIMLRNSLSLPYTKHKNRTRKRDLTKPSDLNRLWETDILCPLQVMHSKRLHWGSGEGICTEVSRRETLKSYTENGQRTPVYYRNTYRNIHPRITAT